ncbi:hypothetical protein [Sediminicola luteus]|uniref:Uncharacterized protein n=1 Tax=Sediminicola luteus TaxID=319238 RepID=A0A2A4GF24_9FLAO|nr:hypothetical protein [Sediminicola luteus]PCE66566.1 hypothetical protein B7P33_04520 [Sediminicola luteus]
MGEQLPTNPNPQSDEIDLGQLFQMIRNGLDKVFIGILKVFQYFKSNFVILAILGIIGLAAGYGLSKISTKTKKTEIIVKPNFESKDYLYGVVQELEGKIKGKDVDFFNGIGIDLDSIGGLKIAIAPMKQEGVEANLEEQLKYLEYLGDLKNDSSIKQVIKNEVLSTSYVNHKITVYFKDSKMGQEAAHKIMDYINANPHFKELREIYIANTEQRIKENDIVIKQIDGLIDNYTKALGNKSKEGGDGTVMLGGEQGLNIPSLLSQKNDLIQNNASSKVAIRELQETIKVFNFGQPQEVEKSFFGHSLVLLPTLLIGAYFFWSLLAFLNKQVKEKL